MDRISKNVFSLLIATLALGAFAFAQDPPNVFGRDPKEEPPKNIQETMVKMQIERNKKDFDEMVSRGEEVKRIAEDLETSFEQNKKLSQPELQKLDSVEKLVKKIRTELGAENDDSEDTDVDPDAPPEQAKQLSSGDAVKSLRDTTGKLYDQLKKTTRFSISVVAIQTSNTVLKLTRFLKITH